MLLFLLSFVLGKIALIVVVYPHIALRIYMIGWVVLLSGMILCGKQGWRCALHWWKKYEITMLAFCRRKLSRN